MTSKRIIFFALLILITVAIFHNCGKQSSTTPASREENATSSVNTDSIVNLVKADTSFKVTEARVDNGILRIAVTNPNPDVVGHFNIMYDLHVARVIVISKDSTIMRKNGITGIAVYTDNIADAKLYRDLIWANPQQ